MNQARLFSCQRDFKITSSSNIDIMSLDATMKYDMIQSLDFHVSRRLGMYVDVVAQYDHHRQLSPRFHTLQVGDVIFAVREWTDIDITKQEKAAPLEL